MKKILFTALLFSIFSSGAFAQEKAPAYKEYKRLTEAQMHELANKDRLHWRIFYQPSKGANAAWFDVVKKGDFQAVKSMVEKGQNIEAKDTGSLGQTALGWAAFIGYFDIVEYLVNKGANVFATDTGDVKSVFQSAILGGNKKVIDYTYEKVKHNLDINAQDENDEETAIMVAAWNHRVYAVNFLLSKGANPNLVAMKTKGQNAYDQNALTYACKQKDTEIINILIAAGAVNHKTGKGACPV